MEVNATPRATQGRGASRRLRRQERVPGILYGGGRPVQNIELDHKELALHLKHEAFQASILTLNLEGEKQQVLLRDLQMHPWRAAVVHVDFQRVAKDKKIHMKVPLHFVNADLAPGVKTAGGTVNHVLTELDVICLPDDLPNYIEVDLANLELGHPIHLADLKLPPGVLSTQLRGGDNAVVASVAVPKAEVEPEVEVAAAAVPTEAGAAAAPTAVPGTEAKEPEKKPGERDKEKDRDRDRDKK
ncbi:MAG TPA: 50S ribosomal protein L25/general stress protein Ctc [Burkholderiales bacterium]|nr:50S ribosomal protein L25/general stress protein Ctc [Burkholderiales bacterium]